MISRSSISNASKSRCSGTLSLSQPRPLDLSPCSSSSPPLPKYPTPTPTHQQRQARAEAEGGPGAAGLVADPQNRLPPDLLRRYDVLLRPSASGKGGKPLALRSVGAPHIGSLVTVRGIVTHATDVKPLITVATYLDDASGIEVRGETRFSFAFSGFFFFFRVFDRIERGKKTHPLSFNSFLFSPALSLSLSLSCSSSRSTKRSRARSSPL